MASHYGDNHNIVCDGCGLRYDDFRTGLTWTSVRREIISIGTDRKTGKTKYGRRRGVLGFWHELKMLWWEQHVGMCREEKGNAA